MSLSSVLRTGLAGLLAAEQTVSSTSDNLANVLTPGYKGDPPNLTQGQTAVTADSLSVVLQGNGVSIDEGAVEQSNADIGASLVEMTLASMQYRAAVNVLGVVDDLSAGLAGIRRLR